MASICAKPIQAAFLQQIGKEAAKFLEKQDKKTAVRILAKIKYLIMAALEDLDDIQAYDKAKANDCGTRVPLKDLEEEILGGPRAGVK